MLVAFTEQHQVTSGHHLQTLREGMIWYPQVYMLSVANNRVNGFASSSLAITCHVGLLSRRQSWLCLHFVV
jgi:hypothetical protein